MRQLFKLIGRGLAFLLLTLLLNSGLTGIGVSLVRGFYLGSSLVEVGIVLVSFIAAIIISAKAVRPWQWEK